jgi:hypothetical protein
MDHYLFEFLNREAGFVAKQWRESWQLCLVDSVQQIDVSASHFAWLAHLAAHVCLLVLEHLVGTGFDYDLLQASQDHEFIDCRICNRVHRSIESCGVLAHRFIDWIARKFVGLSCHAIQTETVTSWGCALASLVGWRAYVLRVVGNTVKTGEFLARLIAWRGPFVKMYMECTELQYISFHDHFESISRGLLYILDRACLRF